MDHDGTLKPFTIPPALSSSSSPSLTKFKKRKASIYFLFLPDSYVFPPGGHPTCLGRGTKPSFFWSPRDGRMVLQ